MKLIYGSILDAQDGVIVHQGNARGYMNSGVAWALRNKWPQVYTDYIAAIGVESPLHVQQSNMGRCIISDVTPTLAVCTLIGQQTFGYDGGRYTSYDAIDTALRSLSDAIDQHTFQMHFPLLGSDRGGGSWAVVQEIIREHFPTANIWVNDIARYTELTGG